MDTDQHAQPDDSDDDALFWARFQHITNAAMAALTEADAAERVAWCQSTGRHGIEVEEADSTGQFVRLVWGGKTLAVIARDLFDDDAYFEGIDLISVPAAPDDLSGLT